MGGYKEDLLSDILESGKRAEKENRRKQNHEGKNRKQKPIVQISQIRKEIYC